MKVISLGLSPNTEADDVFLACRLLFFPWEFKKGKSIVMLEDWFKQFFNTMHAISFVNARSALYAILLGIGIKPEDEVIIQAFTCVVVSNPIITLGAKPIYVDITKILTMDTKDLERKITKKTKAIIVQHTFGIPADMEKIMRVAKEHKLFVIEDVAHTIGAEYKKKKLGTFADAAIFSFGRDKAFSSVFGGIAIIKNDNLGRKIRLYQKQKNYPSTFWIFQQLLHPIAFSIILPLYTTAFLGKGLLIILQKLKLLSFPVSSEEKRGKFSPGFVKRMPNVLSLLALHQLKKLSKYNFKREEIVDRYQKIRSPNVAQLSTRRHIPFLRYPILVDKPSDMQLFFRRKGIYLGDWYANVIDPKDTNFASVGYKRGMCPQAETIAKKIINLPTLPTMSDEDVNKVLVTLKEYVAS